MYYLAVSFVLFLNNVFLIVVSQLIGITVAFYFFKCVRVPRCMYIPLASLYGYFQPISIKNYGMSELTNQNDVIDVMSGCSPT